MHKGLAIRGKYTRNHWVRWERVYTFPRVSEVCKRKGYVRDDRSQVIFFVCDYTSLPHLSQSRILA